MMCVSFDNSQMRDTILYAARTIIDNEEWHVVGYQNTAESAGPNAMLLPFPSAEPMTRENILDISECPWLLKEMCSAIGFSLGTRSAGTRSAGTRSARTLEVFDSGSYTVILASNPEDIPLALSQVPENKRPKPNVEICNFYAKAYPNWPVALCCWSGAIKAEPLLWKYKPKNKDFLFAPALDSHDGTPPKRQKVKVDHSLIWGDVSSPVGRKVFWNGRSLFREQDVLSQHLISYVASQVFGIHLRDKTLPNGDFWYPVSKLSSSKGGAFLRIFPEEGKFSC
jgi:hypothetical protein